MPVSLQFMIQKKDTFSLAASTHQISGMSAWTCLAMCCDKLQWTGKWGTRIGQAWDMCPLLWTGRWLMAQREWRALWELHGIDKFANRKRSAGQTDASDVHSSCMLLSLKKKKKKRFHLSHLSVSAQYSWGSWMAHLSKAGQSFKTVGVLRLCSSKCKNGNRNEPFQNPGSH